MRYRGKYRAPSRPAQIRAGYAAAATLIALVLVAGAMFRSPGVVLATDPTDTLAFLRSQRDACQVMLDSAPLGAAGSAARTRARNCIADVERAIAALLATPSSSPTASPTSSPTPSPTGTSPSPSPSQTNSPTPSPTPSPSPTPTPSPSPTSAGWPDASNTGVPAGTTLTAYTGPCTITVPGTVIDSRIVNCDLEIRAANVLIWRSRVNGHVGTVEASPYSFTLSDSEVDAGVVQEAVVGTTNMTIRRANIHGGALSVYCFAHCDIRDSWLHGQALPAGANWHLGGLRADENDDPHNDADPAHDAGVTDLVAVHNTIACTPPPNSSDGGCSGDVTMYGDFGTINHVTLDRNLFVASPGLSYCLYGASGLGKPFPNAHDIVITNNVFQRGTNGKCGAYGAVTAFDSSAPGSLWSGNVWSSGEPIPPEL